MHALRAVRALARRGPSLDSLIMREAALGGLNKGAVCFLLAFLPQACSSFDVEHAEVRLRRPARRAAGAQRGVRRAAALDQASRQGDLLTLGKAERVQF